MPDIALIIGAAGCGKTTRLLQTMEKVMQVGNLDPREIGFVSFTRAARQEAAHRAASMFDLKPSDLEQSGWFKTLHAVAYKQLAVGDELLGPGKDTQEWLRESLQEDVSGTGERTDDDFGDVQLRSPADVALALWSVARNRLVGFDVVYDRASQCDERTPDAAFCRRIIQRYEQAKRLDHRCDFTDLLGRFAGRAFQLDGALEVTPQGEVPQVPCWFLDESQDNSALVDAVARRLTEDSRWVYLSGDPYQAVYGFGGADPKLFQSWDVKPHNKHILAKSWRCPRPIVDLGEDIIRSCSDYWDRGVIPADHEGAIESRSYGENWCEDLNPNESWLLLARTNFQARRMQQRLSANGVPWVPTKGHGGWDAPQRNKAIGGLLSLSRGESCFVNEWQAILKQVPSKVHGNELFERGTKKRFEEYQPADAMERRELDGVADWGGTDVLRTMLQNGHWVELIDRAAEFRGAVDRWGWRGTLEPKIRIGTVHSAKGLEADNVFLLTTTSHQVHNSAQDQLGDDEERRVAYVACTRTRKRLVVANESTRFKMEIPV